MNRLFYGDNLDVLRDHSSFPDESVDLVYLDPPFNSNRSYNVLFKSRSGEDAPAQIEAFDDTWTWSQQSEHQYLEMIAGNAPRRVADALVAMRGLLGDNDVLAYLVMMAARLVELRRVLKPTGTLYLHCDPTASHYLKVLMDAVFGAKQFLNEIVWCYDTGGRSKRSFPRKHDIILRYGRTPDVNWYYNQVALPRDFSTMHEKVVTDEDGRQYQTNRKGGKEYRYYLDTGVLPNDWWTDIQALNPAAKERLNYPTQKPVPLLARIILASTKPGDLVLDPFCGCGTTIDAAQRLGRRWAGIDITFLAVDLIDTRLRDVYGADVAKTYEIRGIPRDVEGARALFNRSPFEFERWAVAQVDGTPNEKQIGDKGSDGVIVFPADGRSAVGRVLVSVKGGKTIGPAMVRDLVGTVEQQRAEMGIFISLTPPTPGMREVARRSGDYVWGADGRRFPRVQLLTVDELLAGRRPQMPTPFRPYMQGLRLVDDNQPALF